MKKILFILATAAIVASCSDVDTIKKDIQTGNGGAISFTSYSQLATRAENSSASQTWDFFNHHTTFQVWGYKNTEIPAVFSGDVVAVAQATAPATGYTYTYSPLRFWDKAATTYQFYAAAPSNAEWEFKGVATSEPQDQAAGYFKTSSTITGINLMSENPDDELSNTFKGKADIDKLIAEPCSVDKAKFGNDPVQLNFIHILSKLNVSIKKAAKLQNQIVTLKSFEVVNLFNKGDFDESRTAANLANGSYARWSKADGAASVTYSSKTDWTITTTKNYIIESLVVPQNAEVETVALDGKHHATEYYTWTEYQALTGYDNQKVPSEAAFDELKAGTISKDDYNTAYNTANLADDDELNNLKASVVKATEVAAISGTSKPYFKIVYTIQETGKSADQFTAYYNLATAFKGAAAQASAIGFFEGWQNTLNITINPDEIQFDADVYEWSTKNDKDLTIN